MALSRISRHLRQLRRARLHAVSEQLVTEIREAWKEQRHAEVWRLAHLLAGQCRGPRKRRYSGSTEFVPRAEE
eukprot:3817497-Pyramimonas_sp.AAC.1